MEGVKISSPKVFADDGGEVMNMVKSTYSAFIGFGEVNLSLINAGITMSSNNYWQRCDS